MEKSQFSTNIGGAVFYSKVHRFDGLDEFLDAYKAAPDVPGNHRFSSEWSGGLDKPQSIAHARTGFDLYVPMAEKLIDKLQLADLDMPVKQWHSRMVGSTPNVPAFLAGEPECMWALENDSSDTSPIRVYVSTTSSSSIKAEALVERGTTVLALVMALATTRPVELWLFSELGYYGRGSNGAIATVRMNTTPLQLGVAAYLLCHQGFTRGLLYDYCDHFMQQDGAFAWGSAFGETRDALMREVLGCGPLDIILQGPRDNDDQFKNPIPWIQKQIDKVAATV